MGYMEEYCENYRSGGGFWSAFNNFMDALVLNNFSTVQNKLTSAYEVISNLDNELQPSDYYINLAKGQDDLVKKVIVSLISSYISVRLNLIKSKFDFSSSDTEVEGIVYSGSFSFSQGLILNVSYQNILQESFEFSGGDVMASAGGNYSFDFQIDFSIALFKVSGASFPEWLKKIILDTNYRTRKKEVVLSQIYKSLHSKTVFDYLKAFLTGSNLYSSGENTEIANRETASFLPSIIGSADAGLDAIDLLVDVIDYINNEWAQNKELSTLKRIEEGQDNIEEVLTEEEKFSEFLGKSLNIGSSKIVVKENENGTFDFSKFLNITDEADSEFYLSEQILNCLRYNYKVGD